jgi:hypothetical protein
LLDCLGLEAGIVRISKPLVDRLGHREKATGVSAVITGEALFEPGAVAPGEVHHGLYAAAIHDRKKFFRRTEEGSLGGEEDAGLRTGSPGEMCVCVDDGVPRAINHGLRDLEAAARFKVSQPERRG